MMDSAYKLSILIRYKTEFGIIYNQSILLSAVYQEVISGVSGSTLLHTRRSKGVMDPSHEPYATVLEHRNLNSSIRLVPEWKFLARKSHNFVDIHMNLSGTISVPRRILTSEEYHFY
jgi:hypothetical protein